MKRFALLLLLCSPALWAQTPADSARIAAMIHSLTLPEKAALLRFDSPAVERLGIPKYNWWNEALHGVARAGEATMFPMPVGMAASFDDDLLYQVFTAVSDEARIKNRQAREALAEDPDMSMWYKGLSFWTPNINIFRDPRWGRGMETYGEDPYLTGRMGSIVVRGLQGEDGTKLHACAKHFAVHSGPEPLRHSFDVSVSERDLWETYLPAFRDLVQDADVQEVLFAYNSFQGFPCGASTRLLQDILRGEWGYRGIILSDCGAVDDFFTERGHHFVATGAEAVAACVKAGGQLECGGTFSALPEAVEQGLVDEALLDRALQKLLWERLRLGELDGTSKWDSIPAERLCCPEFREMARQMARESLVLLQNDGILPLSPDAAVALVGPNAADSTMMWGNYFGTPRHTVSLLEGLQARLPALRYIPGCPLVTGTCDADSLLAQLQDIDIVIFAGGISPKVEGEGIRDRTSIELPAVQREVIAALARAGKRVILVNFSGSAMALVPESETCAAILQAWYPGQEGGHAVADVLLGDFNPAGRLPVTFYRGDAQLPALTDYAMAGRTYRFLHEEPLWPFGYGLSYTTFRYGKARVRRGFLGLGAPRVVVRVRNTGTRDGDEVVQLYVRKDDDPEGPVKTLRGYVRTSLKAGESRRIVFPLTDRTFSWWSEEAGRMVPGKGPFTLLVGPGSADGDLAAVPYLRRYMMACVSARTLNSGPKRLRTMPAAGFGPASPGPAPARRPGLLPPGPARRRGFRPCFRIRSAVSTFFSSSCR